MANAKTFMARLFRATGHIAFRGPEQVEMCINDCVLTKMHASVSISLSDVQLIAITFAGT
jgi:hypothetical protein